jgi:hypothetical protein
MARNRDLPAIHIGKYWRFRASELDHWLAEKVCCSHHPYRETKESK